MTVVVGFVGSDGAVMAADTEGSESGHTRYDVEKIWTCGSLILGYTGTGSVKQPLAAAVEGAFQQKFRDDPIVERWTARALLRQTAVAPLKDCYEHHLGARDAHGIPVALMGVLLVIGRDENGYWMLELDPMVQATFYTDSGFHTVGSGAAAAYVAHSLMREYDSAGRSVADLKLIAHRTVQNCIDSIGGALGVGGDVRLWYSHDNSPFVKASQQEMEVVENGVEQWRAVERESLNQLRLGGAPEPEGVPLPEPPVEVVQPDVADAAGTAVAPPRDGAI
jgi:20S proteasome alpha/beta subunit